MTMTLVPEDGSEVPPPLDFVLGDVWIMAGSPNLLVTKSGAASNAPTFSTGNTPGADRLLVATEAGSGSPPRLASRFVWEIVKQTSHPSIVYVLAAPYTRVADWSPHRAANDPSAAHRFWNLLGGDARLKGDHPENCALIVAPGQLRQKRLKQRPLFFRQFFSSGHAASLHHLLLMRLLLVFNEIAVSKESTDRAMTNQVPFWRLCLPRFPEGLL